MSNMNFNLNNYVQIKLTEKGKQVLQQKIDSDLAILNRYGIDTSTYDRSEPEDGYWKFQLWEVMQIFGPYMKQGLENVIEMDIILEEKPQTVKVMGFDNDKWVVKEMLLENVEKLQKSLTEEESLRAESLKLLKEEVSKARTKFPGAEDLTVALMEEAGELAQATLKCDSENIKKEALQVACVAMRIFEEGDTTFTKRIGISQDERYEYEKVAKSFGMNIQNFEWVQISNSDKYDYEFKILTSYGDIIKLHKIHKPTRSEFRTILANITESPLELNVVKSLKDWEVVRVR